MNVTLRLLAEWVDGEIDGDGDLAIADARPVGDARPGDITFAADDRHLELQVAAAVLVLLRPGPRPIDA